MDLKKYFQSFLSSRKKNQPKSDKKTTENKKPESPVNTGNKSDEEITVNQQSESSVNTDNKSDKKTTENKKPESPVNTGNKSDGETTVNQQSESSVNVNNKSFFHLYINIIVKALIFIIIGIFFTLLGALLLKITGDILNNLFNKKLSSDIVNKNEYFKFEAKNFQLLYKNTEYPKCLKIIGYSIEEKDKENIINIKIQHKKECK